MKNATRFLTLFLVLIMYLSCAVSNVNAVGANKKFSVKLTYTSNGYAFKNFDVDIYKFANIEPSGEFKLCGDFEDYRVNINGITEQSEWDEVTNTLYSYVAVDKILPLKSLKTNNNGVALFENFEQGLYLVSPVKSENKSNITVFSEFIFTLTNDNLYIIELFPKSHTVEKSFETVELNVIKQWQDNGFKLERPKKIEIDVYKSGKYYDTFTLSSENNWSHNWKVEDDGIAWQIIEKDISKNYTVKLNKTDNTYILTNTHILVNDESPVTGDTTSFFPIIIIMCISGFAIIVLAALRRRMSQ